MSTRLWVPCTAKAIVRHPIEKSEIASSAATSMRTIVRAGRPRCTRAMSSAHSGSAT